MLEVKLTGTSLINCKTSAKSINDYVILFLICLSYIVIFLKLDYLSVEKNKTYYCS